MSRIQRQRTKGWRMPPNAVYVGRPSRWGNPWSVRTAGVQPDGVPWEEADVLRWYRQLVRAKVRIDPEYLTPLRGKDLACWCPLDRPCHADVLAEFVA
jgi:hypothetical protein